MQNDKTKRNEEEEEKDDEIKSFFTLREYVPKEVKRNLIFGLIDNETIVDADFSRFSKLNNVSFTIRTNRFQRQRKNEFE